MLALQRAVLLIHSVLLIFSGLTVSAADPQTTLPVGRQYALLIGVSKYDPTQLRNLPYADRDVTELAGILNKADYRRVVLMTQTVGADDARKLPTAANIRTSLKGLLEDRQADDLILVALAGHGVQLKESTDSFFFCPMDTNLDDQKTLVSIQEIYQTLKDSKAGTKLLLVDACRNDPLANKTRNAAGPRLASVTRPQILPPPGGIGAFYSCSAGQEAYEDDSTRHGIFFHHIIQGLKGAAKAGKHEQVTWDELVAYAKREVPDSVKEKFGDRVRQTPEHVGELRGTPTLINFSKTTLIPGRNSISNAQSPGGLILDLTSAKVGELPLGWTGSNVIAVTQAEGIKAITSSSDEKQLIRTPAFDLHGDFYFQFEIAYKRDSLDARGMEPLQLTAKLLGAGGDPDLILRSAMQYGRWSDPAKVRLELADAPSRLISLSPKSPCNRATFRLERQGNKYSLMADGHTNDGQLILFESDKYGSFGGIELGVNSKIIQIANLSAGALIRSVDSTGRTKPYNLDFGSKRAGQIPKDWLQLAPIDKGRMRVECRQLNIVGDFFVEASIFRDGEDGLNMVLLGLNSGRDLPIILNDAGNYGSWGVALPNTELSGVSSTGRVYKNQQIVFRLEREGIVYRTFIDKTPTSAYLRSADFGGFRGVLFDFPGVRSASVKVTSFSCGPLAAGLKTNVAGSKAAGK